MSQQSNTREVAVMPALPAAGVGSEATRVEQARAVAEVAAAVQVAQMYPRDERNAWLAMKAACGRTGLAERAFYTVPNRGHGPSVHLARELARIWGNMDYGVRETHRDDDLGRSEVLAFSWDQQTNSRTSRSFLVPHKRMVKKAQVQLTDLGDIHLNNTNQGARALRECIFAIMPADFVAEAQEIARQTLVDGDGKPLQQRITEMIAAFGALGVDVPRMEQKIGRSRGQWTNADVADMTIMYGTLKRGETTADEAFPPVLTLDMVTASAGPQNAQAYAAQALTASAAPAPPRTAQGVSAGWPPPVADAPAGNYGPGQPQPRYNPPAAPVDGENHLFDDNQAARILAAHGLQKGPGAEAVTLDPCGYNTPDGTCNMPAGHPTGPDEPGYDGHDVIPPAEGTE